MKIYRIILIITILSIQPVLSFAGNFKKWIPSKSYVSFQYAGSLGMVSAGYFRSTQNDIFEIGLTYGYLPKSLGGVIHTVAFKANFNPVRVLINDQILFEPIQLGSFVTQNFGNQLNLDWDASKYPDDYYWWPRSIRWHLFIGSQVSFKLKNHEKIDRISLYMEANTNDLYISSYSGNTQSLSLTDIIFLGIGVKLYFDGKPDSESQIP